MQYLQTLKDWDLDEEQQAGMNVQLGNYSYQMGDLSLAIECFREASNLITACQGDERILLSSLANLESALRKKGDTDEAAQIHELRLTRLSDFVKESGTFASSSCPVEGASNLPDTSTAPVSPMDSYSWDGQQVSDWLWGEDGHGSFTPMVGLT
jgi:tetratricopeptide (TPR) repeat protein